MTLEESSEGLTFYLHLMKSIRRSLVPSGLSRCGLDIQTFLLPVKIFLPLQAAFPYRPEVHLLLGNSTLCQE